MSSVRDVRVFFPSGCCKDSMPSCHSQWQLPTGRRDSFPVMSNKCMRFLLVTDSLSPLTICKQFVICGTVVVLLITSAGKWWCPSCHFIRRNWISCAGPFRFVSLNGETSLQMNLDYSLSFLKNFFCCITPHNDVIDVLQVLGSTALF